MGLIIIFGVLTFIFTILFVIGVCKEIEVLIVAGGVFGGMGLIVTISMALAGFFTQAHIEKDYEAMLLRKQVIEYRMKHEDIITPQDSEDSLYTQIRDFNQEILDTRTFKDNWWIGVFYNHKIATIDYIDVSRET